MHTQSLSHNVLHILSYHPPAPIGSSWDHHVLYRARPYRPPSLQGCAFVSMCASCPTKPISRCVVKPHTTHLLCDQSSHSHAFPEMLSRHLGISGPSRPHPCHDHCPAVSHLRKLPCMIPSHTHLSIPCVYMCVSSLGESLIVGSCVEISRQPEPHRTPPTARGPPANRACPARDLSRPQ
jgi:hypothetical protein